MGTGSQASGTRIRTGLVAGLASLRTRLTLLATAATLLPLWGFVAVVGERQQASLEALLAAQVGSTASFVAAELDSELALRRQALEAVAAGLRPRQVEAPAGLQAVLDQRPVALQLFDRGLLVMSSDGSRVLGASTDANEPARRLALRSSGLGETLLHSPRLVGGEPVLPVSTPLRDAAGATSALLVGLGRIHSDDLLGVVVRHPLGRTGDVVVVVPEAHLLVTGAEPPGGLEALPAATGSLFDRALQGFTGTQVVASAEGEAYLAGYARVPTTGWMVLARLPIREAFAPVREMRSLVGGGALVLSLIIGLAVLGIVRRSLQPLETAVSTMDGISRGTLALQALPVERPDEVGQLLHAFNRLQERIVDESRARELSQALVLQVLRTIPDLLWLRSPEGTFLQLNEEGERRFGRPASELLGERASALLGPELADRLAATEARAVAARGPVAWEERLTFAGEDQPAILQCLTTPVRGADGALQGVLTVARDVTRARQQEEALHGAREAAEAANLAKSRFLAAMSHEIRTPLNGVLGLAELLQATSLDGQQRAWLETLHRSGVLLLSILNGILDFSKIEAGRLVLESIPLDLRELVGEVGSLFEPLAREKGLILRAEVDPGLPTLLLGDPVRLRQVLSNLVSNALKFTAVGSVAMRVRVVGLVSGLQRVRVEVQDTGIGLSEADRARLFVPFSQVDPSTTRRFGGTGLGLVISQAIVEAMGGRIEVESAPGVGATFSFQLALGVPLAPEARAPRPEAVGLRGAVLVAEDNPVNALVARLMLRGLGLEVAEVRDGQQAVEAVRARAFDLVLMDLHMPVLDGLAATRAIRAGERGHLPIVALTADALPEDRARCLAEGMDDYLSKPLRRAELEQVLRRWLTTRSAA